MGKNKKNKTNKFETSANGKEVTISSAGIAKNVYNYRKNYDYKGKKNETDFPDFVKICKLSQEELKILLPKLLLQEGYADVVSGNGYIYAKGKIPVLLTAHMDTVHEKSVEEFYEYYDEKKKQRIISSPQGIGGDDRCGIYMILEIIKTHKCSVLFCEDEEIGGIGSGKFCKTDLISELENLNYLIELDRANGTDAVFYDCDNNDFTDFILSNTGYTEERGSFSDISSLSPACMVASVNLSCGYYNAHTTSEYVIIEEMLNTIETVKNLLDAESEQFEYVERYYGWGNHSYGYGKYYDNFYADYYGNHYDRYYDDSYCRSYSKSNNKKTKTEDEEQSLFIHICNEETGGIMTYVSNATSTAAAFGKFFINNPEYCYNDIYDYECYDLRVYDDGWYNGLYY